MANINDWSTPDLSDENDSNNVVLDFPWQHYGKARKFCGRIGTVNLINSNRSLRQLLSTEGNSRVCVVDANGVGGHAVVGDQLSTLAIDNNWVGVVIYGRVRDVERTNGMDLGLVGLGKCPIKAVGDHDGEIGVTLNIAGVEIKPDMEIFVDNDGVLIKTAS